MTPQQFCIPSAGKAGSSPCFKGSLIADTQKHPKNIQTVDKAIRGMIFFLTNTETLEAKVKPEGTPTESGER